jgi:hypothetical protein
MKRTLVQYRVKRVSGCHQNRMASWKAETKSEHALLSKRCFPWEGQEIDANCRLIIVRPLKHFHRQHHQKRKMTVLKSLAHSSHH